MNKIIYILLLVLLTACNSETEKSSVDVELQTYFESFKNEALKREISLNLKDERISGFIEYIPEQGVIGNCTRFESGKKELTVDKSYWTNASNLEKEFVVFHELGHCILGRVHLETKDNKGVCRSMMTSGKGNCHLNYNASNRDKYLDELFKS